MDTIIIGAGLAGLAAAQRLVQGGRSVTLLEARDRLGGRLWTRTDPSSPTPIELGPEWIAASGGLRDLMTRAGAPLVEARGNRYRRVGERWENLDALPDVTESLIDRVSSIDKTDRSLRDALTLCCGDARYADARSLLLAYVEGFHAADPERVSVQWLATVEENQPAEASDYRAPNGAGQVIDLLRLEPGSHCVVRLGTVAHQVRWRRGEVEIAVGDDGETFQARSAIVTVPLPMLDPSFDGIAALRFVPTIDDKLAAAALLEMGHVVKLVLRFREPLWQRNSQLEDMLFLHTFGQPIPTWWTSNPSVDTLLTAWVGGPTATRLGSLRSDELLDLTIASLSHGLAMPRSEIERQLVAHYYHNWMSDPFTMGAYTYVKAGGLNAHRTLAQPVHDTVFFAGEATCGGGLNATMEGALESGWRAADDVLRLTSA
jgi:monoamine oxidase